MHHVRRALLIGSVSFALLLPTGSALAGNHTTAGPQPMPEQACDNPGNATAHSSIGAPIVLPHEEVAHYHDFDGDGDSDCYHRNPTYPR